MVTDRLKNPTRPVPVRLDAGLRHRLKLASKKMGSSSSAVIRLSIIQLLPAIEAGNIKLSRS